jgi:hypothetical protein
MTGRLAFNLFLLALVAYFVWSATGYEPQARQIPLLIGGLVLVLQAWVTVKEAIATELAPAAEGAEAPPPADERTRVAAMCGWMLLFFALFVVLGTLPAVFLFILLFLVTRRDVRWWMALAISVAMAGAIWLLFVRVMRFELYPGVLFGGTLPAL